MINIYFSIYFIKKIKLALIDQGYEKKVGINIKSSLKVDQIILRQFLYLF